MLTYAIGAAAAAAKRRGANGAIRARYSVYLLFWYKSTNTDAEGANGAALPVREFLSEYTTKPVTFSSPDKESAAAAKQVYAALSCACMRP